METRDEYALQRQRFFGAFINRSMQGIEIGPSYRPVAPKLDGWNCKALDHCDKKGLIAKYSPELSHMPELINAIEDVDFVWSGGSYAELAGCNYDYIIACHVIEHQPDLIGFFKDAASLMIKGVCKNKFLLLAIPDKRKTFDFPRPLSTLGEVLLSNRYPSAFELKSKIDNAFYMCRYQGAGNFSDLSSLPIELRKTITSAREKIDLLEFKNYIELLPNEYEDRHRWVFTNESFVELMKVLRQLDMIQFRIVGDSYHFNEEFYVIMQLVDEVTDTLNARVKEVGQHSLDSLVRSMVI